MTLIKRSDVKNHLSTRSGSPSIFPPELTRPDAATGVPAGSVSEPRADGASSAVNSDRMIVAAAAPNPQTGDSVAIAAKAEDSERRS